MAIECSVTGIPGGELHIVAKFPNRPPVRLTEFGSIAERHPARARSRPAKRAAA